MHVMFDVVIHVPIQKLHQWVDGECPATQAKVTDIILYKGASRKSELETATSPESRVLPQDVPSGLALYVSQHGPDIRFVKDIGFVGRED